MNFFPIVPIRYLGRLAGLSNHQMVLAHWLVEKRYFNFYKKRKEKGDFIILDNGTCELGTSIPVEELIAWNEKLGGCNVLVVPDTKEGSNLELVRRSLSYILEKGVSAQLMGVPQSLSDLDEMVKIPEISVIGLSRTVTWDFGLSREIVIEKYKDCGKRFHLLGLRRDPFGEILAVKKFGDLVLGVDSSLPYRIVSRGRTLSEYRPFPDLIDMYQRDLSQEVFDFCIKEFKFYLGWIGGLSG